MVISIEQEAIVFLTSVTGGLVIGLVYDLCRCIRKILKSNKGITFFLDIIFWITSAGICFYFLNFSNEGEIRGFIFIGFLLGIILYFLVVGNKFVNIIYFIFQKIYNIIVFVIKIILIPIKIIFKILLFIFKPFNKIFRFSKNKCNITLNILTKDIKKGFNIIRHKK
jgi:spore cortex biosynthesis protein YabQ